MTHFTSWPSEFRTVVQHHVSKLNLTSMKATWYPTERLTEVKISGKLTSTGSKMSQSASTCSPCCLSSLPPPCCWPNQLLVEKFQRRAIWRGREEKWGKAWWRVKALLVLSLCHNSTNTRFVSFPIWQSTHCPSQNKLTNTVECQWEVGHREPPKLNSVSQVILLFF